MSKRIILFRHAKSDWQADFKTDHERPLSKRGEKASRTMGKFLATAEHMPDYTITSSAVRAKMTLELAASEGWKCEAEVSDALYETSADKVLEVIHGIADQHESAMLIGHNPTWSELASLLVGGGQFDLPTAAMVCIDFEVATWAEVAYSKGELVWFQRPKIVGKMLF